MRYLYALSLLFFSFMFESKAQNYIVTLADENVYGEVSNARRNKVTFKAEAAKKAVSYLPLQIKGYYYKGVFYASKVSTQLEKDIFAPSFREGDDPEIFKKETTLEVKAYGKVNFYHGFAQMGNGELNLQFVAHALDIKDSLFYTQIITKNLLAEAVSDYSDLHKRVLEIEGYPNIEQIAQVVREYNAWHEFRYSASEE